MATKTVHTVTLPDGTTAKRTSVSRVYSHAVAVGPCKREVVVERMEDAIAREVTRMVGYERVEAQAKAGTLQLVVRYRYGKTELDGSEWWETEGRAVSIWPERHDGTTPIRDLAHAQELAATRYGDYAKGSREGIERMVAELEATKTGPELVGGWGVEGWQSRPDLAAKAQATAAKNHPGCQVVILEAQRS